MVRIFYIAIGGAAGATLRYWLSGAAQRIFSGEFPWATLSVNLIGSLAIGFLWGMLESVAVSPNIRVLLFVGVIGSFTTFSAFSLESFHLLRDGQHGLFLINVMASFFLSIALVFVGHFISQYLFASIKG